MRHLKKAEIKAMNHLIFNSISIFSTAATVFSVLNTFAK